jgi:RNA-directed DNA polymerase
MTIDLHRSVGASSAKFRDWKSQPWDPLRQEVRRLQMRIAKAIKDKKYGRARSLQWILTHSHSARMLAVQRVTTNKGRNTRGKVCEILAGTDRTGGVSRLPEPRAHGYPPDD